LKHAAPVNRKRNMLGIPRPRAGASLKLVDYRNLYSLRVKYPPPAGGGLIEAGRQCSPCAPLCSYPPPAGGGLIEAANHCPGRTAAAPYPPPAGGGLIEAVASRCKAAGVHPVSPARGRGPH